MNPETLYTRINKLSPNQRELLVRQLSKNRQSTSSKTSGIVAYITGSEDVDIDDLKEYIKQHLPAYMAPNSIVQLEILPKLPNGKLDLKAIPSEPEPITPAGDSENPISGIEKQLIKIWQEVLGFEPIHISDNFFEIGGDSILSIQIVAKARQEHIVIAPNQLFEHQTISELATVVRYDSKQVSHIPTDTGPAPLTPIQHWFFETHEAAPHHWNQGLSYLTPGGTADIFKLSIEYLVARHDALRLSFQHKNDTWLLQLNDVADVDPFHFSNLSGDTADKQNFDIAEQTSAIQANFNLCRGDLFKAIYFDCGKVQENRLVLIAHHLIIDALSWKIVVEELGHITESFSRQIPVELPATTAPFNIWARQLSAYAQSPEIAEELTFWQKQDSTQEDFPIDFDSPFPQAEKSIKSLSVTIDAEETAKMRNDVPRAYNTRTDEFLIAALAHGLKSWRNVSKVCVGLEGHGRSVQAMDLDVTRSVGWFTSYFPIALSMKNSSQLGDYLQSMKEQLRNIPREGVGYGLLRYVNKQSSLNQNPSIIFNYLGDQTLVDTEMLSHGQALSFGTRDPDSESYCNLEINAYLQEGELNINFRYSQNQYQVESVLDLAEKVRESIQNLIRHCITVNAPSYSPSDFPDTDISQSDLNNLLDQL